MKRNTYWYITIILLVNRNDNTNLFWKYATEMRKNNSNHWQAV